MKHQALFSAKDKSKKKTSVSLLQFCLALYGCMEALFEIDNSQFSSKSVLSLR